MQYLGSKKKLIPFIQSTIYGIVGTDLSDKIFCDLFTGTATVGRFFKNCTKQVIANDLEFYSFILNRNYIGNHEEIQGSGSGRMYFSDHNGKKIDTLRQGIENLRTIENIDNDLYYFLLASLLEGADRAANVTAAYTTYLKHFSSTTQKPLILEPANFEITENSHQVFNENANTLIQRITGDVLYIDAPYSGWQYGANYHLLNTIALYDNFVPKGKTGKRAYNKSAWCRRRQVEHELDDLLKNAQFKYIFLSYNNEGLMSHQIIKGIMSKYGHYDAVSTEYKRFKSDSSIHKANRTTESIHVLEMQ